jgi:hypothetical protein
MVCLICHTDRHPGVMVGNVYYCMECWDLTHPFLDLCHVCEFNSPTNINICPAESHKYCQNCIHKCKYCNNNCCYLCIEDDNNYCGPFVDDDNCDICSRCYNICECEQYLICPGEDKCKECSSKDRYNILEYYHRDLKQYNLKQYNPKISLTI